MFFIGNQKFKALFSAKKKAFCRLFSVKRHLRGYENQLFRPVQLSHQLAQGLFSPRAF